MDTKKLNVEKVLQLLIKLRVSQEPEDVKVDCVIERIDKTA